MILVIGTGIGDEGGSTSSANSSGERSGSGAGGASRTIDRCGLTGSRNARSSWTAWGRGITGGAAAGMTGVLDIGAIGVSVVVETLVSGSKLYAVQLRQRADQRACAAPQRLQMYLRTNAAPLTMIDLAATSLNRPDASRIISVGDHWSSDAKQDAASGERAQLARPRLEAVLHS